MNKAPLMDTAKINVLPDYPETLKDRKIALFTAQRDSDHEYYSKLIEELNTECEARLKEQSVIHSMQLEQLNTKYEKMQEWYDAALDWREMEIQRVRKETARNMLDDILKNKFTVESMIRNRNGHREVVDVVIIRLIKNDIVDLKSKYGIEGK